MGSYRLPQCRQLLTGRRYDERANLAVGDVVRDSFAAVDHGVAVCSLLSH